MVKSNIMAPAPRRDETIVGWCWYGFQMVVLGSLLTGLNGMLRVPMSQAEVNFTYFLLNFLATVWIFHKYLESNWKTVKTHPILFSQAVVLGLVAYWLSFWALSWAIRQLDPGFINRNDASISGLRHGSFYLTMLGTVLLAPVAEECVYRGLVFRNLYRKNKWAAYIISIVLFAMIHILGYLGQYSPLELLMACLQYLPAGLCLAWSYAKADTIFAPMIVHAAINFITIRGLR